MRPRQHMRRRRPRCDSSEGAGPISVGPGAGTPVTCEGAAACAGACPGIMIAWTGPAGTGVG
eukprot:346493-Chlamydomonas_euryale.AAC.2